MYLYLHPFPKLISRLSVKLMLELLRPIDKNERKLAIRRQENGEILKQQEIHWCLFILVLVKDNNVFDENTPIELPLGAQMITNHRRSIRDITTMLIDRVRRRSESRRWQPVIVIITHHHHHSVRMM